MRGNPYVLVVEDDGDISESLRDVLVDAGYRVGVARDGVEAMEMLGWAIKPDALVLDLRLPRSSGVEMLENMRKHVLLADIPIVVLSPLQRNAPPAGTAAWLRKPVPAPVLLSVLEETLEPSNAG